MSSRSRIISALSTYFALLAVSVVAAPPTADSRLATYDGPAGESYFALSLQPTKPAAPAGAQDVLVLFDTSASQAGVYREHALESLNALIGNLGNKDRVSLMAIDLNAVPMTQSFVNPKSADLQAGVKKLEQRVPLGSTDMLTGVRTALKSFGKSENPRAIVYIGDGVSGSQLISSDVMQSLIDTLQERRISVSSYAIGPRRDLQLLGTLAHRTGGV